MFMLCPPRYLTRIRKARLVPKALPTPSREYLIRRYVQVTLVYFTRK